MKNLKQIYQYFKLPESAVDLPVVDLCLDSREIQAGSVFVAYAGGKFDGKCFAKQVVKKGAIAIISDGKIKDCQVPVLVVSDIYERLPGLGKWFYDDPSKSLNVIGVTGTNGKTSVAYFIAQLLQLLGEPCGYIGTLGWGFLNNLQKSSLTSPDVLAANRYLAGFGKTAKFVVMEVSAHALDQNRVQGIKFDGAVFTNLTQDHLDYFADEEEYFAAKAGLFAVPGLRFAAINLDDYRSKKLVEITGAEEIRAFSCHDKKADVCLLENEWKEKLKLIGTFNRSNLAAAIAALLPFGFSLDELLSKLPLIAAPPGRMQKLNINPVCIVDYAHTPDALANVLSVIKKEYCHGRVIVVFGCGGNRDCDKRHKMGAVAERYADKIILTNDNPRFENPEEIIADILAGIEKKNKVTVELDRAAAIKKAIKIAEIKDWILIAGKGHEKTMQIGDEFIEFDDEKMVRGNLKC